MALRRSGSAPGARLPAEALMPRSVRRSWRPERWAGPPARRPAPEIGARPAEAVARKQTQVARRGVPLSSGAALGLFEESTWRARQRSLLGFCVACAERRAASGRKGGGVAARGRLAGLDISPPPPPPPPRGASAAFTHSLIPCAHLKGYSAPPDASSRRTPPPPRAGQAGRRAAQGEGAVGRGAGEAPRGPLQVRRGVLRRGHHAAAEDIRARQAARAVMDAVGAALYAAASGVSFFSFFPHASGSIGTPPLFL